MEETNLVPEFIDRHGRECFDVVQEHAGTHTCDKDDELADALPEDRDKRFVYTLLELAEHGCAKDSTPCEIPLTDDDLFNFLLRHHSYIADQIPDLPSRGAEPRYSDLELIYPDIRSADLRVEIESKIVEGDSEPKSVVRLAHDQRTDDGSMVLACLVPFEGTVEEGSDIRERFPTEQYVPQFTNEVNDPVDIIIPVPRDVWVITSQIAPGFMTLDGWDLCSDEHVNVQIGVVASEDPTGSRRLLNQILGEEEEWPS